MALPDGFQTLSGGLAEQSFSANKKTYQSFHPYLIAEIGVNHGGSMAEAQEMISLAAKAGASAVKFQSYTAGKLAAPGYSPSYWDRNSEATDSQFDLFSKYDKFTIKEFEQLADFALENQVDFLSTPFDLEIAEELAPIVPAFKVASADITNGPLIARLQQFGLPLILSTGAASVEEIGGAADRLSGHGASVAFLHCVLNYPTLLSNANIQGIRRLQEVLPRDFVVGYSDHVAPTSAGDMPSLQAAFLMGSAVIEKHFTNDRAKIGNDHYHSADYDALRAFVDWMTEAREMMGSWNPNLEIQNSARTNARRRIFASQEISAGTVLTAANLVALRANDGIEISEWDGVLGKAPKRLIPAGEPLQWSDF